MTKAQMASLLRLIADELEKAPAVSVVPASGGQPREWVVKRNVRGRCPSWVLLLTGLATKQEVIRQYKDGYKFVEGIPPTP